MLEEATQIIRGLLTQPRTTFHGKHFTVENASCLPRPVQKRLPIIIGGLGEKRTLRIAARHGDAWNAAYISPQQFKHLSTALDQWCEKEKRDPASIERSVNLVFNVAPDKASEPRLRRDRSPAGSCRSCSASTASPLSFPGKLPRICVTI